MSTVAAKPVRDWMHRVISQWDSFWFSRQQPHTLALIRILGGWMLFYTHLVWALDLRAFLGANSWVSNEVARQMNSDGYAFSYLWFIESPTVLWIHHIIAMIVFAMLTVGLWTRAVSILAWVFTMTYCHRLTGALFGLDQVNAMIAFYLMIGPSGGAWSLDRWLKQRKNGPSETRATVGANVAIRLLQLHMCIIYLFGGIGKMRGETWWDGSAFWYAISSFEYQSMDVTWMGRYPILLALITHLTVFWETFYCFTIWPKLTRPITLVMAVVVHGGIALCMGMITFGTAMIIGNLAFVSPSGVRNAVHLLNPKRKTGALAEDQPNRKQA